MFKRLSQFLKHGIWRISPEELPFWKAFWIRVLKVFLIIGHGFTKSQIQLGAATLTYYTLLAIVPIIALFVAVTRVFRIDDRLKDWLIHRFSEQEEIIQHIIQFADNALNETYQGLFVGMGLALLIWAALKILILIEQFMNQIWEVPEGRSFTRRFSDYLALICLTPVIILLLSGLSIYVSSELQTIGKEKFFFHSLWPVISFSIKLVPYALTCIVLTFLYIYMPNTRVKFLPALYAGIITGIIFQLFQHLYVIFQIGMSRYNVVWGTFAALPLFLLWTHLSWIILFLGAKIAFAFQNLKGYEFVSEDLHLNNKYNNILYLRITHLCVKQFVNEEPALSAIEISNKLSIPLPLANILLHKLVEAKVLSDVKRESDQDTVYQPARNIEHLTIKRVLDMINAVGDEIQLPSSTETRSILNSLDIFDTLSERSTANQLLKNI